MSRAVTLQRIVVSVTDLEEALAFYRGVLELEIANRAPGFAWLRSADGVELMLHERASSPSDTAVAVGFATPALDEVVARWAAAGGAIVDAPEVRPWGERMAVVRDADGHVVCLSERA